MVVMREWSERTLERHDRQPEMDGWMDEKKRDR